MGRSEHVKTLATLCINFHKEHSFRSLKNNSGWITMRNLRQIIESSTHREDVKAFLDATYVRKDSSDRHDVEHLRTVLRKGYVGQAYRLVRAALDPEFVDERCWQYITLLIDRLRSVKYAALTSVFFLSGVPREGISGLPRSSAFAAPTPTLFERLLFLMKTQNLIRTDFAELDSKEGERGKYNRVGYAIQNVVRAWDMFAYDVNFPSAEHLVIWFLVFDKERYCFKVQQGDCSPPRILTNLNMEVETAQPTYSAHIPTLCKDDAVLASTLRRVSKDFLHDIELVCNDIGLFKAECPAQVMNLRRFKKRDVGGMPSRFTYGEKMITDLKVVGLAYAKLVVVENGCVRPAILNIAKKEVVEMEANNSVEEVDVVVID